MVFGRLLQRQQPAAATFPDGRVGFAVGDIHGRSDLLHDLLVLLEDIPVMVQGKSMLVDFVIVNLKNHKVILGMD